jgi:hypothetical protein
MSLSYDQYNLFVSLLMLVRNRVNWSQAPYASGPPASLPSDVLGFLSAALGVDPALLSDYWTNSRGGVWQSVEAAAGVVDPLQNARYLPVFFQHSLLFGIGLFNLTVMCYFALM